MNQEIKQGVSKKQHLVIENRIFLGQFQDGLLEGSGQVNCPDEFLFYSGEWHRGKPHGQGQCSYLALGAIYKGQWQNGLKSGQGELHFQ